ncbi:MAG TPA: hypothetical protein PKD05_14560 [Candidatus Melainabacteria bacterium]|nr:hypothetical protein [Candidatus Melainabacteria bacterium]
MSVLYVLGVVFLLCLVLARVLGSAGEKNRQENPIKFVCRRCEHIYVSPDLPAKCRSCGGNVEPH